MSTKKNLAERETNPLRFFRGGKGIPESVVRRHIADLQKKKTAQIGKMNTIKQKMAECLSEIQKAAKSETQKGDAQALDRLLSMHKKLASQKLTLPNFPRGVGGILAGSISVKVVPPYDYDVIIPSVLAGNEPTISGSADRITGKMSVSAVSSSDFGFNGGGMYTTVGIYFHPMTAGSLTVSINPSYSFEWWTNSLAWYDPLQSFGEGAVTVYGVDVAGQTTGATGGIETVATQQFKMWNQQNPGEIQIDTGFDLQTPASLTVNVDPTQVYLLFVEADVDVQTGGWPGSLAGAMMSVSVPYIAYDFQMRQVFA